MIDQHIQTRSSLLEVELLLPPNQVLYNGNRLKQSLVVRWYLSYQAF